MKKKAVGVLIKLAFTVLLFLLLFRPQTFVFLAIDKPLRLLDRPALLIQTQLADHSFDQPCLIVAV